MDKDTRNTLRNVVTNCRQLLEEAVAQVLEGQYGVYPSGRVEDAAQMGHLTPDELAVRERIVTHLEHIQSGGFKPADAADQLIREIAFTHLNRLAAYKMMEQRGLIRESVSRGLKSQGFMFYMADHPADERLWSTGQQDIAYRHFLVWQGEQFADEISVLFSPYDPANFVFPPQRVLDQVLDLINSAELADIWTEDETIGWVYQYFTPKELRDKARSESQAPRNSYELAFRNQFYTPRYVVEFLTDNTLGRTWYEMLQGDTALIDHCRYLVRRPTEIFLSPMPDLQVPRLAYFLNTDALNGHFEALPETPNWPEIMGIALVLDGYRMAPRLGLGDCGDFANEVRQHYRETGELPSSSAELWICLFFEQRRYHHFGTDPEGKDWEYIQALYRALRAALTHDTSALSQEELLQQPVYIPYRELKDPRRLKVLDPACGSGHFLLYAFDLLAIIYEEAWQRNLTDDLGMNLRDDYDTLDRLRCNIPRLILALNLHGIDIDRRATQIAALALWLRAQRYYNDHKIDRKNRPAITQGNIVVAEPMPGDRELLDEFVAQLEPPIDQMVKRVFNEMKLAGEAGSLLKIEEAIQDDIARAREEWERRLRQQQTPQQMALLPEWIEKKPEQLTMFDVSKITDAEFFDRAEHMVLEALEAYAQQAENGHGLRRRLFADDAAGGFAFIELMRRRYDVALMNPPYGDFAQRTIGYAKETYSGFSANIYSAFWNRITDLCSGFAGGLTSRTFLTLSQFGNVRELLLDSVNSIVAIADLGAGVLDTAAVDTCASVIECQQMASLARREAVFLRLEEAEEPEVTLMLSLSPVLQKNENVYIHRLESLGKLPGKRLLYWASPQILQLFETGSSFQDDIGVVKPGLLTGDDFRFTALWFEISPVDRYRRWFTFAKGGDYERYYADLHFTIDWMNEGETVKAYAQDRVGSTSKWIFNEDYYFVPGITFPNSSALGFSARCLPKNSIISVKGQGIFPKRSLDRFALALLNTWLVHSLLQLFNPGKDVQAGDVKILPFGEPVEYDKDQLNEILLRLLRELQELHSLDETSPVFRAIIADRSKPQINIQRTIVERIASIEAMESLLDNIVYDAYGISNEIVNDFVTRISSRPSTEEYIFHALGDIADNRSYVFSILSYFLGIVFGRWNIRYATGEQPLPDLPDPFEPLPVCPPGMLQNADGLPATETPPGYPLDIDWDGILVDDPDHPDDIIRRVRGVFEVLWADRAEAIEQEACEILGVKDLRDYFRKPGSGGFWDDHVKRYSKSRRKAPIYWLLQSSRKNYALWLYYHRLDKDLYYKALINYVQPKLRLEQNNLNALRAQLTEAGVAGREAKRLEREVEQQEALMSELQDFHDALERAAQLNLEPDLNDGVVLNIAPLHELVPWKEAETYWKALLKGEYEWSTISQQLHARGIVK